MTTLFCFFFFFLSSSSLFWCQRRGGHCRLCLYVVWGHWRGILVLIGSWGVPGLYHSHLLLGLGLCDLWLWFAIGVSPTLYLGERWCHGRSAVGIFIGRSGGNDIPCLWPLWAASCPCSSLEDAWLSCAPWSGWPALSFLLPPTWMMLPLTSSWILVTTFLYCIGMWSKKVSKLPPCPWVRSSWYYCIWEEVVQHWILPWAITEVGDWGLLWIRFRLRDWGSGGRSEDFDGSGLDGLVVLCW